MILLSIDVGLKNLSYCLFDDKQKIKEWKIINIMDNEVENKCNYIKKDKKECNKTAKYLDKLADNYYCQCCLTKIGLMTKKNDFKGLSKKTVIELKNIGKKYDIEIKMEKKKEILDILNEYNKKMGIIDVKKRKYKLDFIEIGKNIRNYFDLKMFSVTHVIIEDQMTSKMKQVQCLLAQYFITKKKETVVEFINPSNKLKNYDTDNSSYKKRKNNAISICETYFLDYEKEWKTILDKEKKKDDLCDCFLQGKWYMEKK
uniref:Mitochondrial resolvase Ydc2 catalytic domain-containing protein n=1 Tax=viral metagenome TaxID=1070528 RepID=A0A6C0H5N3_9ZZZZ